MTNRFSFIIIAIGLVLFSLATVAIAIFVPGNAELYALFAGILGNFSGSLFTLLHVNATTTTTSTTGIPPATVQTKVE